MSIFGGDDAPTDDTTAMPADGDAGAPADDAMPSGDDAGDDMPAEGEGESTM